MIYRIIAIIAVIVGTIGYTLYSKNSLEKNLTLKNSSNTILAKLPSNVDFTNLDGKIFNLNEFFKEETPDLVMVHFWGTWCAPCEAELPELLNLIKKYESNSKIKFLLVATNDEVIKVQKHLKTLPIPKASIYWLLDNKNVHRELFGTTRVPETYIFSSDKTILRKFIGPQEWNKSLFFQLFDEFVQISTRKL